MCMFFFLKMVAYVDGRLLGLRQVAELMLVRSFVDVVLG